MFAMFCRLKVLLSLILQYLFYCRKCHSRFGKEEAFRITPILWLIDATNTFCEDDHTRERGSRHTLWGKYIVFMLFQSRLFPQLWVKLLFTWQSHYQQKAQVTQLLTC